MPLKKLTTHPDILTLCMRVNEIIDSLNAIEETERAKSIPNISEVTIVQLPIYTVERSGLFPLIVRADNFSYGNNINQCGMQGQNVLQYRVRAQGPYLDGRGFLVEHGEIQVYFSEKWKEIDGNIPSCEQIATVAVNDLVEQFNLSGVQVKIWSNPHSGVSLASSGYVHGLID